MIQNCNICGFEVETDSKEPICETCEAYFQKTLKEDEREREDDKNRRENWIKN